MPIPREVGWLRGKRWLVGGLLIVAIAAVSASAFVFEGRDEGSGRTASGATSARATTSTTTSATTTTPPTTPPTTTAEPSPPAPAPEPTPVAVAPPPPTPAPVCDGGASPVIGAMNADRASAGIAALCSNRELASFAQSWANWMAENQSLTHQDISAVLGATSFSTVGENILSGPGGMSADQMEAAWMASPSHRQNIMNGAYSAAGVGVAHSSDGRIWVVVDFGG